MEEITQQSGLKRIPILTNGRLEKYNKDTDKTKEIYLSEQERSDIFDSFDKGKVYLTVDHRDHRTGNTEALGYMEEIEKDENGDLWGLFDLNTEGTEAIEEKKYKRTSILARPGVDDKLKLISVSLTNMPADVEQPEIVFDSNLTNTNQYSILILGGDIPNVEGIKNNPEEAGDIEAEKNTKELTMTPEEKKLMDEEIAKYKAELEAKQIEIDQLLEEKKGSEGYTAELTAMKEEKEKGKAKAQMLSSMANLIGLEDTDTDEIMRNKFTAYNKSAVAFDNSGGAYRKKNRLNKDENW